MLVWSPTTGDGCWLIDLRKRTSGDAIGAEERAPVDRMPHLRLAASLLANQGEQAELDAMDTQANDRADRDDPWYAAALERAARHAGDAELVMQAVMRGAGMLDQPLERASLAMRAAEVMEPLSVAQASVALMGSARGAPEHPVASEELGRLCKAAGE